MLPRICLPFPSISSFLSALCSFAPHHRLPYALLICSSTRRPPPALSPSSPGWSFPWGLRARLAELLLRGIFDTLDEGQYTEQRQELVGLLQGPAWRQLGVTPDVHSAVFAWVHYRQVGG